MTVTETENVDSEVMVTDDTIVMSWVTVTGRVTVVPGAVDTMVVPGAVEMIVVPGAVDVTVLAGAVVVTVVGGTVETAVETDNEVETDVLRAVEMTVDTDVLMLTDTTVVGTLTVAAE